MVYFNIDEHIEPELVSSFMGGISVKGGVINHQS